MSVTNIFEDPGFVAQLEAHWKEEYAKGVDSYPVCVALADPLMREAGVKVLDVGCGVGRLAEMLPSHVNYHGLDSSAEMVDRVHQRGCGATKGSVYSIPFPDEFFDVVICNSVLIHCGDVPRAVKELWRVTKKRLITTYYWKWSPFHKIEPLLLENYESGTNQWIIRNTIPRWMIKRLFTKHIQPARCQFYFKDGVHLAKEKIAFVAADRNL